MNKAFYNFIWENYPSDKSPLNDVNLMKINNGIDEIDNRVIVLDSTKFDKSEAQLLVKYIEYDEDTGIFKITHYNGTSYTIDTLLEKLAINFDYDYQTQKLIITLSDGEVKYVDLSALITQYEFLDSGTIDFQVQPDGKVTAIVKEGSIEEKHLRPNYLADIKVEVAKAQASQTAAKTSETNADTYAKKSQSYAVGGTGTRDGENTDNSKYYSQKSKEYSDSWKGSLLPKGTIPFSQLPTSGNIAGHMYNISKAFETDGRFKEGAGYSYPAGTNVYWTADGKWDCLSGALTMELTQAEYDALSQAEKMNGTIYYIMDADNSIGEAGGNLPGLMSAADKEKLDGIEAGATRVIVDASLSLTSGNAIQNKAVKSALDTKAPLASPAFSGTPTAPTAAAGTNNTQIATTAFVKAVVNALVGGAPTTLDTLKEIADAIEAHQDVTDALNAAIGTKVDKVSGKGLSTNDYSTAEKNKLAGIAAGAEVNVQPDWNVTDTGSDAYIKNKPTSLPANGGTAKTISDTLPISKGGTGQTTAQAGLEALTAGARTESETYQFSDEDSVLWQYTSSSGNKNATYRTKFSKLWNYIKSKLATVATSGSYTDLINKPSIPAAVRVKGNAESSYRTGDVNLTPANIGALALTGGTVTGATVFSQGTRVGDFGGGSGTAGYMYLCQVKITTSYMNQPIEFKILQRGRSGEIHILFVNANNNDPSLSYFRKTGNIAAYIVRSTTGTWDIYVQKTEAYDNIAVIELRKGSYMGNVSVTWKNQTVTALPTGYTTASAEEYNGNAASANKLITARKIGNASFNGTANITLAQIGAADASIYGSTYVSKGRKSGTTVGQNSFVWATGSDNSATQPNSVILGGSYCTAAGISSVIIGGYRHNAAGFSACVGGYMNTASGDYSACLGGQDNSTSYSHTACIAGENNSIGNSSKADYSVCIGGNNNIISATNSCVSGENNTIESRSNHSACIAGNSNTINNDSLNSVIIGGTDNLIREGSSYAASIAGHGLTVFNNQVGIGHYNSCGDLGGIDSPGVATGTGIGTAFFVGNGFSDYGSNAVRIDYNGKLWCKSAYSATGADYAELFEWEDGNPDNEDRRGYFVAMDGKKIRKAMPGDYILGVVSGNPCVIGNTDTEWQGQFLKDEFGAYLTEEFTENIKKTRMEIVEKEDGTTERVPVEYEEEISGTRYVLNPDYDPDMEYVDRISRPEWNAVGMMGVLSVYDDGTCFVGGYCNVTEEGIATYSGTDELEIIDGKIVKNYKVARRINENIVEIVFR